MGLRISDIYDYCNVLNITKAILGVTSKIHYSKIECIDQTKDVMCKSMKDLFENSYVIPLPQYVNIAKVLEKSVMNVLECNVIEINKLKKTLIYMNYELLPYIILIVILYFLFKKNKKY